MHWFLGNVEGTVRYHYIFDTGFSHCKHYFSISIRGIIELLFMETFEFDVCGTSRELRLPRVTHSIKQNVPGTGKNNNLMLFISFLFF